MCEEKVTETAPIRREMIYYIFLNLSYVGFIIEQKGQNIQSGGTCVCVCFHVSECVWSARQ